MKLKNSYTYSSITTLVVNEARKENQFEGIHSYLGVHERIYKNKKDTEYSIEEKFLLDTLEYYFALSSFDSDHIQEFIDGIKAVHRGENEYFSQDDSEDFGSVNIGIDKSNPNKILVIGSSVEAKEKGISDRYYIDYDDFMDFLQLWKTFIEETGKLRLVPLDWIKEEKVEDAKKNVQLKLLDKKIRDLSEK